MQDKISKLTNIKKDKIQQNETLKHLMTQRQPNQASTDIQLLELRPPQRRMSCPYVKGLLMTKNAVEMEEDRSEEAFNMIKERNEPV